MLQPVLTYYLFNIYVSGKTTVWLMVIIPSIGHYLSFWYIVYIDKVLTVYILWPIKQDVLLNGLIMYTLIRFIDTLNARKWMIIATHEHPSLTRHVSKTHL